MGINIHSGSWTIPGTNIPLPDFGITEKVADFFGQSKNVQGGSQLRQGTVFNVGKVPYQYSQTPVKVSPTTTYIPDAGGGYYSQSQPQPQPQPQPQTQQTSSGGGGGNSGGSAPNPETTYVFDSSLGIMRKLADIQREQAERENRIRGEIENTYKGITERLDKLAGLYPQWEQEDVGRLQKTYETQLSDIGTEKQAAEKKLGLAREDIERRKKLGMQEISQNLRQLLKATGMQLGAMGAGSSSAAEVVAPYALSKEAARSQAQVIRGANEQLAEIDRKAVDVQTIYDQEKNNLERWLQEKRQQIADAYRQLKSGIEQAKMNADENRMRALTALDTSLLQNAVQMANYYEQQANQYRLALDEWVRNRMAQLNNFKLQMQQSGNFNPQDIVYSELRGIQGLPQRAEDVFLNPMALIKKRRKELGLE